MICGLLDGLDALRAAGVATDDGRLFLVGGGARSDAYRQILADLAQRPVLVTAEDELVALGACVQAAARVSGVPIADVQDAWALGMGTTIDPVLDRDRASAVRAAYASAARLGLSGLGRGRLRRGRARRFRCQRRPPSMAARIVSLSFEICWCTYRSSPIRRIHGLKHS